MENKGFIAIEALVGLFITLTSCLTLIFAFENMNDFSNRQRDQLNTKLAFIKLYETKKKYLIVNNDKYIISKLDNRYWVKNLSRGTEYKIEKS